MVDKTFCLQGRFLQLSSGRRFSLVRSRVKFLHRCIIQKTSSWLHAPSANPHHMSISCNGTSKSLPLASRIVSPYHFPISGDCHNTCAFFLMLLYLWPMQSPRVIFISLPGFKKLSTMLQGELMAYYGLLPLFYFAIAILMSNKFSTIACHCGLQEILIEWLKSYCFKILWKLPLAYAGTLINFISLGTPICANAKDNVPASTLQSFFNGK